MLSVEILPHTTSTCYFNSIYITVIGTVLSTTMCAMYAYVLYRPDFKFRSFFNFLSFFTMIFGGGRNARRRRQRP